MTKTITASAPGKIHFLGEHTAVYGKPALLAAIDKRCTVSLTPTQDPSIQITSKNFNKTISISVDEIFEITHKAHEQWEKYIKSNDIAILKTIVKDPVIYPIIAIGETLHYFDAKPETGFHLVIDSHIPLGSGLGSSAAVAVSVVGAVTKFLSLSFPRRRESSNEKMHLLLTGSPIESGMTDLEVISKIAIRVEQKKHGNPSYGDVGVVLHGGLIWFQKKSPEDIVIEPLDFSVPKKISDKLLIIQTGEPRESTGEMVHVVSEFKKKHPERFEQILKEQGALTEALVEAIKTSNASEFQTIIQKGEANLETIGVVSESTKALIRDIEQLGGVAKICGAGGKTKGSGIVLAYHNSKSVIELLAKTKDMTYYTVQLGGPGLAID